MSLKNKAVQHYQNMAAQATAGHTPGPWTVDSDKTTVSMGGQCVIVAPAPDGAQQGEVRANASLIAAAPELLAALQDAEFLMRQAGKHAGPMQDSFNRSAYDARAAIARAKGEA